MGGLFVSVKNSSKFSFFSGYFLDKKDSPKASRIIDLYWDYIDLLRFKACFALRHVEKNLVAQ